MQEFDSSSPAPLTPVGLEPAIPGSVGQCLIHWATRPSVGSFGARPCVRGMHARLWPIATHPFPPPHSGRLHACRVYRRGAIASPQHDVWAWPRACRWCCARAGSAAPSVTLYDRTTICCMRPQTFCVAAQADLGRTRTCNPRPHRPMPYPLGHGARCCAV